MFCYYLVTFLSGLYCIARIIPKRKFQWSTAHNISILPQLMNINIGVIHRIHKAWSEHGVEALYSFVLSTMPRPHARSRLYELSVYEIVLLMSKQTILPPNSHITLDMLLYACSIYNIHRGVLGTTVNLDTCRIRVDGRIRCVDAIFLKSATKNIVI